MSPTSRLCPGTPVFTVTFADGQKGTAHGWSSYVETLLEGTGATFVPGEGPNRHFPLHNDSGMDCLRRTALEAFRLKGTK